jgi:hypothetical protein
MKAAIITALLRLLTWLYIPILILEAVATWSAVMVLCVLALVDTAAWFLLEIPLIWLLGQFLWSLRRLWYKPQPPESGLELRLPRDRLHELYRLAAEHGQSGAVLENLDIRLVPDNIGCVYEEEEGVRVLVIGGMAIRALSQQALAAVIGHLLSYFQSGETSLAQDVARTLRRMSKLDDYARDHPSTKMNPLFWPMHAFAWFYRLIYAAHARQQVLAADRRTAEQFGKETAAITLVYLTALGRVPYLRLDSVAELYLINREALDHIFAEQQRRAQTINKYDWEEACQKELDKQVGWCSLQPSLRDRLRAIGMSAKEAVALLQEQTGPPARELFPDWDDIEKQLTERYVSVFREEYGMVGAGRHVV